MGELAALAEMGATKELISNAFHCPIAFFMTQMNLANRIALQTRRTDQAVAPRLETLVSTQVLGHAEQSRL